MRYGITEASGMPFSLAYHTPKFRKCQHGWNTFYIFYLDTPNGIAESVLCPRSDLLFSLQVPLPSALRVSTLPKGRALFLFTVRAKRGFFCSANIQAKRVTLCDTAPPAAPPLDPRHTLPAAAARPQGISPASRARSSRLPIPHPRRSAAKSARRHSARPPA